MVWRDDLLSKSTDSESEVRAEREPRDTGAQRGAARDSWRSLRRASLLIISVFVRVNTFQVKINFPFGLLMTLFLMLKFSTSSLATIIFPRMIEMEKKYMVISNSI